jgi:hypothetical protein
MESADTPAARALRRSRAIAARRKSAGVDAASPNMSVATYGVTNCRFRSCTSASRASTLPYFCFNAAFELSAATNCRSASRRFAMITGSCSAAMRPSPALRRFASVNI